MKEALVHDLICRVYEHYHFIKGGVKLPSPAVQEQLYFVIATKMITKSVSVDFLLLNFFLSFSLRISISLLISPIFSYTLSTSSLKALSLFIIVV